ncbi:MAG: signal peptidase I [Spirochaetales bacterium]|nr:signal peptidase I [Spirochaetales bacterium]
MRDKKTMVNMVALIVIILFSILMMFLFFFTDTSMVVSGSMNPLLQHGDRCLSLRLSFGEAWTSGLPFPLKRKDVVIISDSKYGAKLFKRVIGLPGETLELKGNQVLIDGRILEEPYALVDKNYNPRVFQIPMGKVMVLGDNRSHSRDSREFGLVDIHHINGKVLLRFYPIDRLRFFSLF